MKTSRDIKNGVQDYMKVNNKDAFDSQVNLTQILNQLPSMMWRSGLDAKRNFFNQSWLDFTGRTIEQEMENGWLEGIHPEDVEGCYQTYLQAFEKRQPFEMEYRLRHSSGEYRWILDIGQPYLDLDGHFCGFIGTCYDLTERKQAEQYLREREKLLTTAALSAPLVFFKVDRAGIVQMSFGRSLAKQLGKADPVGKSVYDIYKDVPEVIENIQRAFNGETLTASISAGNLVYEATYTPLHNEQGEITDVVGVAADVSAHRQVEEALRESENHFRTIFNDTVLGIKLIDPQGRIVESNPALQEMLGYEADELRHMSFVDLTYAEDAPVMRRLFNQLVNGKIQHFRVEKRYVRKDGQIIWGRLTMSSFHNQQGKPVYGIGMIENITAQKTAEGELAEVQRRLIDSAELERLRLAQELHDGPLQDLQSIGFRISILEGMIENSEGIAELQELQQEMHKVSQSLRQVCGELRPPALSPFGLERTIRSHAERFQEQHPDISVHLELMNDGKMLTERVRLALFRIYQQSMANIVRHAHARNVEIHFGFDENQIQLRIIDDGQGFRMPGRWVELVRGGHFGLVGSTERAESVGGKMEIESKPGVGTEITVTVPRREEDQVAVRERGRAVYSE